MWWFVDDCFYRFNLGLFCLDIVVIFAVCCFGCAVVWVALDFVIYVGLVYYILGLMTFVLVVVCFVWVWGWYKTRSWCILGAVSWWFYEFDYFGLWVGCLLRLRDYLLVCLLNVQVLFGFCVARVTLFVLFNFGGYWMAAVVVLLYSWCGWVDLFDCD